MAIYDARCASCHSAGAHDTAGFAGDLKGKGPFLVSDLGTISSVMSGLRLTDQELLDMKAFLDSL
jgi:mono/diheme cytochrome c family protein